MEGDDGALERMGRNARRVAVAVGGGALIIVGVALLALPGPGMVVIVAGLAVLATEFPWAKSWLAAARRRARGAGDALRQRARRTQD
ncbi:MAG TPA: PGPGW domain-containing protein [Acidimicrobiales bacterium]|nr:PGPGW domain-containing protein [Acidimicrobiales bacterium]